MRHLNAYLRTIRQYATSPKGRHDILDYLYAGVIFILTTVLIMLFLRIVR
ncbi:hypothetical protein HMPREF9163_00875 [Selenomonas sp. oral taxon 138 str. F0429]|nr:hypothetical protein HMPREF9163_00875 [Selenomonas sp. oral taxon 138 str. F0429]